MKDLEAKTLRDEFAAQIMQALTSQLYNAGLQNGKTKEPVTWAELAEQAYSGADAMLAARSKS